MLGRLKAPDIDWLQLFTAALGGGVTVKVLDIIYQEFRRRSEKSNQRRDLSMSTWTLC